MDEARDLGMEPAQIVNLPNINGKCALHFVSQLTMGLDTIELLLDNAADINAATYRGTTALILAAAKGRNSVVKLLLVHGADVAVVSASGFTPSTAGFQKLEPLLLDELRQKEKAVAEADWRDFRLDAAAVAAEDVHQSTNHMHPHRPKAQDGAGPNDDAGMGSYQAQLHHLLRSESGTHKNDVNVRQQSTGPVCVYVRSTAPFIIARWGILRTCVGLRSGAATPGRA